ncbi:hypothetical protein Ae201684P_012321 [Aphanomyces euteiches]|nr:hypothetical protein Ae201684P_012321 [Aphanomyces euteiches]
MQKLTHLFRSGSRKDEQLVEATLKADYKRIRALVARGADVNYQDKDGQTPLIRIATLGYSHVTKVLLACGADAELSDKNGVTPLHHASSHGHMDVVKELLAHGASINRADKVKQLCSVKMTEMLLPRHYISSSGFVKWTFGACQQTASPRSCYRSFNSGAADHTPLHRAAYFGKLNVVKELIAQGANVNSKSDASDTALQLASWGGHWNIVQELMTHGLSIHSPNKRGVTPLHHAACNRHAEVVQQHLVHGVQVDVADQYGRTPLHYAASQKRVDVVKELLAHGAFWGNTPLHLASKSDNVDRVKENDPSVKTTKKTRKHIVASANDQLEVLQLLLDAGVKRL